MRFCGRKSIHKQTIQQKGKHEIFSRSQLHCLGLASFLARTMREPNGFIVFDDSVVSSDEDYRAHFVCTVLKELLKLGQQVILLTQDQRTWKDVSERYASENIDVFQITRDTGVTTVAKTSDDLVAMMMKAEPYVRSDHPELRKRAAELLRDAVERFSQPSHRLTGFSTKKALASVRLRATRHGYENKKPKTKANEA